ncbi:MAG: energy transducer TonB [Acidobacteria bacterium]|nr:energy transducer TonB [Acidobacteriota bacterium]
MFESLGKEGQRDAGRYLTSMLVSLVIHTAVLGVLIVLPMMFLNVLHADDLIAILIAPPSVPEAPPPPVPPTKHRSGNGTEIFRGKISEPPGRIPDGVHPELEPPDTAGLDTVIAGISNLPQGEAPGAMIGEILKMKEPVITKPPKPPIRPTPIRVSGVIQEGKLIHRVDPPYPKLALIARVSGSVRLEAVIDEEGSVTDLKIVEGHPLLNEAAYNAVKQWKYLPTLIGGEPVPVLASVTVIFRIR